MGILLFSLLQTLSPQLPTWLVSGVELPNSQIPIYFYLAMVDRSAHIKIPTGQIFWRESGDSENPVVIFLHGSWADSQQWKKIVEPLSKNFHCFAIDLLGFGNSMAIETPSSIQIEVDCLHDFLTVLKLRPVYLVGYSLGAWVAVSYTLKYPDLVQGVVAISPEGFSLAYWQQYDRFTKWLLMRPWLFRLWLKVLKVMASVSDGADPMVKHQSQWNLLDKFPTTYQLFFERSIESINRELVAERLSQFRKPFLVLQNELDDRLTIKQSQAYAKAVWKSEYQWIKNAETKLKRLFSI
ncbi:MAG: alpha/beta hydrolase [Chamaesiphon sp.]|nr:alpha/beta hydrolase [Chamaesiphon sp.]